MKKIEYEDHRNKFLKVKEFLQSENNDIALARAFKKPFKWYGKYTVEEAVKILKMEGGNNNDDNI